MFIYRVLTVFCDKTNTRETFVIAELELFRLFRLLKASYHYLTWFAHLKNNVAISLLLIKC